MQTESVSVTQAARNFARFVNRAHYQGITFVLLKNGVPVARLAPAADKICLGRELAAALAGTELPEAEARAWRRDLRAARKKLKTSAAKRQ